MQRCCQAVVQRTLRCTDTPEEAVRKALWVPLQLGLLPILIVYASVRLGTFPQAMAVGMVIAIPIFASGLLWPILLRSLPINGIGMWVAGITFAIICWDLQNAAELATFRSWTFVVLVMDMALAFDVPLSYQKFVLYLITVWVLVTSAETSFRLGLYDIGDFTDNDEARDRCGCADPPCHMGMLDLLSILPTMAVLHGDYFATRGFAEGLRDERAKVVASIKVAEQVAAELAGFDLVAARDVLESAGDELPKGLHTSFDQLLRNLGSYRPYLPQSCFEDNDSNGEECDTRDGECTPTSRVRQRPGGATQPRVSFAAPAEAADKFKLQRCSSTSSRSTHTSGAGSMASSAEGHAMTKKAAHAPQLRRVTLLTVNSAGLLSAVPHLTPEGASAWLQDQVEAFASAVKAQGGLTDLLSGDHHSASFGAVKSQGSQRASAVRAAEALTAPAAGSAGLSALPRTAAVCSGRALCGDFGSNSCQRFMVIGGVSALLPAAERAAAAWRVGVLTDTAVQSDSEQFWSFRLRQMVRFPKLDHRPIGLWELLGARMGSGDPQEWMYELETAARNPWQGYNDALIAWSLRGADSGQAAVSKALADGEHSGERAVGQGLLALREVMQEDPTPPVGDWSSAVFAGAPAPLAPRTQIRCDAVTPFPKMGGSISL